MPCNFLTILNDDSVKATLDGTDKQFSSGKLAVVYRQENLITMIRVKRCRYARFGKTIAHFVGLYPHYFFCLNQNHQLTVTVVYNCETIVCMSQAANYHMSIHSFQVCQGRLLNQRVKTKFSIQNGAVLVTQPDSL